MRALGLDCISNSRSRATKAVNDFAPKTFAIFSLVVGFPFVAKTRAFFLSVNVLVHDPHKKSDTTYHLEGWL